MEAAELARRGLSPLRSLQQLRQVNKPYYPNIAKVLTHPSPPIRTATVKERELLSAIAKHDPKRARWIAEAADAPSQSLEALELGDVAPTAPPPIAARILIDRRGLRESISIWLDWVATAQLIQYAAWQDLTHPDSRGLAITISIAVPNPPRGQS